MRMQDQEVRMGWRRTAVGENISIPIFSLNDSKAVKTYILNQGGIIAYESPK